MVHSPFPQEYNSINLPDYIISDGNLSLSASENIYGFESLYNNPFASINASLPLNTIPDFDNTTNFGYGDIPDPSIVAAAASSGNSPISSSDSTYEEVLCDNHQIEGNLDSSDDQDNSQKNSPSVNGLYDPLAGLATAASMISCNQDSVNGEVDVRNRRPHLVLDIKPNAYDFGYIESLASSPSSAVTMPPTPVYFDVTNSTIPDSYTFFQTDQSGSIFTADKIIENPQTVSPAAVTFTPNYTSMITPNTATLDSEQEYFNQQFHSQSHSQPRRRKSISTSNPQNIKTEPRTPALSPPESPNESISSAYLLRVPPQAL
ncbi:6848_t:CDS:2 [Diversispora eburnea]|uniref:6848_t:CDS:1 n=1 Tax=Diversispora eburnea TaxID=1213867 RepID=A0A9N9FGA6_9GLOM|nr:6848_t:CDS:2 [Diversispora eburnea]